MSEARDDDGTVAFDSHLLALVGSSQIKRVPVIGYPLYLNGADDGNRTHTVSLEG